VFIFSDRHREKNNVLGHLCKSFEDQKAAHDYVLNVAIPKTVYQKGISKRYRLEFEVIESPAIIIDIPPEFGLR